MGFYVLLKLYDLININKKIVIYGGLYHIDNIKTYQTMEVRRNDWNTVMHQIKNL
jgi:hypothetical protein